MAPPTASSYFFVELLRADAEPLPAEPELPPVIEAPPSEPSSDWLAMLPPAPLIDAPLCEPL